MGIFDEPLVAVGGIVTLNASATWLMHKGYDRLPFDEAHLVAGRYLNRVKPGAPMTLLVNGDLGNPLLSWPTYLRLEWKTPQISPQTAE
jgi:hypothetical protein